MSLNFINDFQNQLYKHLSSDKDIMESINKIYFGAIQDGKSPFLLINIINIEDLSRHVESIYSVRFQISAYAKDNNYQLLIKLADHIVKLFASIDNHFSGYMIAAMKAQNIHFEKAKDLVLNKLIINYKALIKKGGV